MYQLRQLLVLVAALVAIQTDVLAQGANNYPSRPITVIVPMSPGGTADLLARNLAPLLTEKLGQSVMIDNRVGANGAIGEEIFSRAKPDGYTLMLESTSIATNPWMSTLSYDPRKAFTPSILIAAVPLVLVVNNNVNAQSAKEFIALAKASPGQLNYASWGNGSIGQFAGEIFKSSTKTNITHVPYKSTAQALSDTLAGQVDAMFPTLPLVLQQLGAGKIRALALASSVRSPLAPEIPTMAEVGVPGVEVETWFGIFLPAATPDNIVDKINQTTQSILNTPSVRAQLEKQGFRIIGGSRADFNKYYLSEINRYGRIVKEANLKASD
jgi:tripartite-type tricarboxylate transporter receptor subunit TctC